LSINANVLIVRLKKHITKEVFANFPHLKYILSPTTGTDHIDLEEMQKRNIQLICLKGETKFLNNITSTPELTWGLLLSLTRNISKAIQSVQKGEWERDRFRGIQLKGKTIGIIGMGRVGKSVANYATSFGMKVIYFDLYVESNNYYKCLFLNELLSNSDIISIHIHLNNETRKLINNDNIPYIKQDAYIINTSRGGVVDESALVTALKAGKIKGLATDVLETELSDINKSSLYNAMLEGENIIITPHIGGASYDAMRECENFIVDKFLKYVK
jgi:D-3-phosphoglycerate dehydrogenase